MSKHIACLVQSPATNRYFSSTNRSADPHFPANVAGSTAAPNAGFKPGVLPRSPAVAHNDCRAIVYRRQSKVGLRESCESHLFVEQLSTEHNITSRVQELKLQSDNDHQHEIL
ncbi:hypothetical protein Bbelb_110130 [Branchiostoma belcheri]|nr:hypothetical protein Bbelb_110130 [Branchiostoma belcheri]